MERKEKELLKLKDEIINCKKCSLYQTRNLPVIGEGNHSAKIMFVGEAPGVQEDRTGHPFCGKAGEILDILLKSIGLKRSEVYITNVLKCRPPENRDPKKEEIESCSPFLERQIEIIKPKIICALGRYSMRFLMQKYNLTDGIQPISQIHGRVFEKNSLFENIKIVAFYHPATATYNPNILKTLEQDFKILKKFI